MKFIVSSSSLLKQLQQISGVINANTVLPILEDFSFSITDKKLSITATDLETVMRVQMDVESNENGRVCVPARILLDSLKTFPTSHSRSILIRTSVSKLQAVTASIR